MATIMNLNDKGFDYLCALSDISKVIEQNKMRGVSADDTLEILEQLGRAAERRFDGMLEDLHAKQRRAKGQEEVDPDIPWD